MTPVPCSQCGSTTYNALLYDDRNVPTCAACLIGLTPMLKRGIPIRAAVGEKERKAGKR